MTFDEHLDLALAQMPHVTGATKMPRPKLVGYKSPDAARRKGREISTNPSTLALADGSWVATGDTMLMRDNTRTRMLYGAWGSHMTLAEATIAGMIEGYEGRE